MAVKSKKLPIIGISANHLFIDSGSYKGYQRVAVVQNYIQAVLLAGGVPLILPNVSTLKVIQQHLDIIDGLILSGGNDIQPRLFGEEPHPLMGETSPERDFYEITLVKKAVEKHKPILGVCRGLQLLNVAFGGSLYQDLSLSSDNLIQHSQQSHPNVATHTVDLVPETTLHNIIARETILTNSFHHQGINRLAEGFVVNARAKDGVIEGIEKMDHSYIMGVQWHPEFMVEAQPEMLRLFKSFVDASQTLKSNAICE